MSIDARIASVMMCPGTHGVHLWLRLRPIQASDGTMSIPGQSTLIIAPPYVKVPKAGQQIWGGSGFCIVVEGFGGERIEYAREGNILREKVTDAKAQTDL